MNTKLSSLLVVAYLSTVLLGSGRAESCGPQKPIAARSLTFSSEAGTATLIGFSEFTNPSLPPRKFLTKQTSGTMHVGFWPNRPDCTFPPYVDTYEASGTSNTPQNGIFSWTAKLAQVRTEADGRVLLRATMTVTNPNIQIFIGVEDNQAGNSGDLRFYASGDERYINPWTQTPPFPVFVECPTIGIWGWRLDAPPGAILPLRIPLTRDVWDISQTYLSTDRSGTTLTNNNDTSVRYQDWVTTFPGLGGGNAAGTPNLSSYGSMVNTELTATKRTVTGTEASTIVANGGSKAKGTYTEELTQEDTERSAENRALITSGTNNIAFRESRTTGFSWGFRAVTYTATFDIGCPGEYDVFVRYTVKGHNAPGQGTPKIQFQERKRFESGVQTLTAKFDVKQKDVDYTITSVEARAPCLNHPPGEGSFTLGSVRAQLSLGRTVGDHSAGALLIEESALTSAVYSPAALVAAFPDEASLEAVYDPTGSLRQVKVPQALVDVVTLAVASYEVRFYLPFQIGVRDSATNVYAITGTPFVTYRIDDPGSLGAVSRLRITETRGATATVTEYSHEPSTSTWSLSLGGGLRKETETTASIGGDTVKTRTVRDSADALVSQIASTYHTFPWGEELTKEVIDPNGAALTTRYDYYDNVASSDLNYKRLKERTDATGAWQRFTYDSVGRIVKTVRPFLDAASTTDESTCRVSETIYDMTADADGDGLPETRTTVVERVLGHETGRRYTIEWSALITLGSDVCKNRSEIVCTVAGAAWSDTSNLVTKRLINTNQTLANRDRRVINPNGTATLTITLPTANGTLTQITKVGQPSATFDEIIDGRRTDTVSSATGQVISQAVTDVTSGLVLESWTATEFDSFGRPTRIEYSDGTLVTRTYACCGVASERDRSGLVTTYSYDALGRQVAVARAGITARMGYDAEGRVLSTTRVGSDASEMGQSSTTYDSAGRILSTRDAVLRTTTFAESFDASTGHVTRTTTNPGGGTVIEVSARDGSRLSVSGTAATPRAYDYGVDATGSFTKDTAVGVAATNQPTATEWIKSYTDLAGRSFKTVFADGASTQSFYNAIGQLVRQIDPDGVTTLFAYNARGEQEVVAVDVNANGLIDYGGSDRIAKTTSAIATKVDGATYTVQRTTTQVWETDNQNTPVTVSVSEQSVDGLRSWQTSRGLTSKSVSTLDGSGGRTVITTAPDGVQSVQVSANGRIFSSTIRTAANVQLSATINAYDAHGRTVSTTDARNGTTTLTYFADDQLNTVTTPDPDSTRSGPGYDAQTTTYTYDSAGRVQTVTQPDGTVVNTTYYPTGAVKRTWGSRTYPVEYTYDPQGRVKTLTTWQNFAGDTGKAATTWNYDAARGFLLNKRYADNTGPNYTYKPSGRLLTRTWARTPAVTATYTYHSAGDLLTTAYSDPTPSVAITYDRSGRPIRIVDGADSRALAYHPSGQLQSETYTAGLLNGHVVSRTYDALLRPSGIAALNPQASPLNTIAYSYDAASRLDTVTSGANTASYVYLANSPLVESVTYKNTGTTRLTATKSYDKLNRLSAINAQLSTGPALSHTYTYNAANQRTRTTREDNAYWSYAYDSLGQVTSAGKFLADATPALGLAHAYAYDDIGNRQTATTNGQTATYAPNLLNQYTQRTVPATVDVSGAAAATATVTIAVNNTPPQPTTRQGETFFKQLTVDNSVAAQNPTLTITGVKNLAGPNGEDAVTQVTKTAFLARTPETFTHDADGNLTDDARWHYTWDAENRLIALETSTLAAAAGVTRQKLEFSYDAQGRRITKKVSLWNPTALSYQVSTQTVFLYDGWNLLAELNFNSTTSTLTTTRSYVWGQDVSGSFQRAGGVGGLISVTSAVAGVTHFPTADGNGNIAALAQATDGTLTAKYDYNAFGETIATEGPFAAGNPFRFSTKYTDDESGHLYYGYRCYAPQTGRWLSRDPIEDQGGVNLYAFVGNNPINRVDPFGLWPTPIHNQIIDEAFADSPLADGEIQILKDTSRNADAVMIPNRGQAMRNSYRHSMRAPYQSTEDAQAEARQYITQQLAKARGLQDAWRANGKCGYSPDALREFGYALHTVTDSTSPSHAGAQPWNPANIVDVVRHIRGEASITPAQLHSTADLARRYFGIVFK